MKVLTLLACTLLGTSLAANAAGPPPAAASASTLHVTGAWVRVLPSPLPAGGYFTLRNDGDAAVTLTGASAAAWEMVMLHRSVDSGGQSRMTDVDTVTVPPHGSIHFAPGGYHLMLMDAQRPLRVGGEVEITLHFADGAALNAPFRLRPAAATGP